MRPATASGHTTSMLQTIHLCVAPLHPLSSQPESARFCEDPSGETCFPSDHPNFVISTEVRALRGPHRAVFARKGWTCVRSGETCFSRAVAQCVISTRPLYFACPYS